MVKNYEKERIGLTGIEGPLIFVEGIKGVGYGEMVEVIGTDGRLRRGQVLEVSQDVAAVQVFEGTTGLSVQKTRVRFLAAPLQVPVSTQMLGRIFDSIGRPIDGGSSEVIGGELRNVNGLPIAPTAREYPQQFIETGLSVLDGMNTLVRGQKLPVFSGAGLPHNELAAQLARQAKVLGQDEEFAIVFAAMGVKNDTAEFFRQSLVESGAITKSVLFINVADDPPVERLVTPKSALTVAEYLAFEKGMHVLVILIDMTNYAEALREVASARGELPSRKGYPGYLYSDFASIYERAGRIKGREGSVTQIPVLTMPNDDITHPVPDMTGYITEGQIVLSRNLYHKGIYPPIDPLPSLSRLMKDAIGEDFTRADHPNLASQLYASYSRVQHVRSLASVIGQEGLSQVERNYLEFGEAFERYFIGQGMEEARDLKETLDLAWEILSILPVSELYRLSREDIRERYGKD